MEFSKKPTHANFAAVWLFLGFSALGMGFMTIWEHSNEDLRSKLAPSKSDQYAKDNETTTKNDHYEKFSNIQNLELETTTITTTNYATLEASVTEGPPRKLTKEEEIELINKQIGELRRQYARKLASLMRYRTFRSVDDRVAKSERYITENNRRTKTGKTLNKDDVVVPEMLEVDDFSYYN